MGRRRKLALLVIEPFAPVLQLRERIPLIQERLRHAGLPLYDEAQSQEVILIPGVPMQARESVRWVFTSADRDRAVVLDTGSLVLEASRYDVFDTFVADLQGSLATVGEIAGLTHTTRRGLRYVNRIEATPTLPLARMLGPDLLALSEDGLGVEALAARFEWTARTEAGRLVIRLTEVDQDNVLPSDLQLTLLDVRSPTPLTEALVLDTYHYCERQRVFDVGAVIEEMWELHRHTDRAFRNLVSPEALETWGAHDRDQD